MRFGKPQLRPKNPNGGPRGVTEEQLREALEKNGGNVLAAANALGVTDRGIYMRLKNHPELAAIKDEAKHRVTQMAEGKVIQRISRDDWPAISLWLTTQAGWSRRTELSGVDGAPLPAAQVTINVNYVEPASDDEVL